ncbi:MAG TPA: hypothetical protein PKI93_00530 [Alphaproteobacteria bacterium]|nr:hypothetical protein [Alphaproteobacteria bacterium]HNS44873.1 hypothetical protein [Alphaproteobacteria bacterium]
MSVRDHSKADRPHLRGYIKSILTIEGEGPKLLANMMSKADTADELLNYDPEHVAIATLGALHTSPVGCEAAFEREGIGQLAKSLKRDSKLYAAFVATFNREIEDALHTSLGGNLREFNRRVLERLAEKHPDLREGWEPAQDSLRQAELPKEQAVGEPKVQ